MAEYKAADKMLVAKAKALEEAALKAKPKNSMDGFITFLKTQNVAGLAIGLAVGAAASDTVKQFVHGFIDPIVQLLIGSQASLQQAHWEVTVFGRTANFEWGGFVSSFITLMVTALVFYLFLRMAGFYKPVEPKEKKKKNVKK